MAFFQHKLFECDLCGDVTYEVKPVFGLDLCNRCERTNKVAKRIASAAVGCSQ